MLWDLITVILPKQLNSKFQAPCHKGVVFCPIFGLDKSIEITNFFDQQSPMQFMIVGLDGNDSAAPERRASARESHLKKLSEMQNAGTVLHACALLNKSGEMNGSMLVVSLPTRDELDQWLKTEPYVVSNVWQEIQITEVKVAPVFLLVSDN